jgi:hypothetical protein
VPGHLEERLPHARREGVEAELLARQLDMHVDDLDHVPTQHGEMLFGHRLHRHTSSP